MLVTVPLIKIPYVENFPTFSEKQGMNALAQLAQTDFVFLSWDPQRPRKLIAGPLCHCRPWSCWQHDGPFEIRKRNRGKKKMTGWIKKKVWEISFDEFQLDFFFPLGFVKYYYILEINHPYLRSPWVSFWSVCFVYLQKNYFWLR